MRILHTESSRNMGGQELRILEQVEWLNRHGHQAWLAARPGSAIAEKARGLNLPLVEADFRASLTPSAAAAIFRTCRNHRIQLIDAHGSRDASASFTARWLGVRVVRTQHMDKGIKADWARRSLWRYGCDHLVATSGSIARRFLREGVLAPEKISVVGEGIPTDLFRPDVDPGDVRERFRIPADAKVVTVIGMIRPDKGQVHLVRAVDEIVRQVPSAWFLVVGGPTRPEYLDALRAELSSIRHADRVVLAGFQENIPQFMAASDVIVICSTGVEAQSRIAPQAFAMKKVLVASRVGGVPELVQEGVTGFLYPRGDSGALAAKVTQALTGDYQDVLANAYDLAQRELTFDVMMERTLDVYRRVLELGREPEARAR